MKRIALVSGILTLLILDLLALDDITTSGDRIAETVFLIASIPALLTLARYLWKDLTASRGQEVEASDRGDRALSPGWWPSSDVRAEAERSEISG